MICLVTVKTDGGTTSIVQVEALQYTPTVDASAGQYLYTTTDDKELNKLLNNYDKIAADITGTGELRLTFDAASEDPSARVIADSDWLKRTRPALMRAATTTHLFNA